MERRGIGFRRVVALMLIAALAACGGGGGASPPGVPHTVSASTGTGTGLHISLSIPANTASRTALASRRSPKYVSPATKSVAITVNGGAPTNFNVTAGSPGCQADLTQPSFTEFPVNLEPRGVAVGSDGGIWFVEDDGQSVGRYQIGGGYVDRSTGVTQNMLVSGADGALWIADVYSFTIGHMTTSGAYSQFSGMPTDINQMAVASDGSVWYTPFTYGPMNALYHVSSSGTYLAGDTITTQGTTSGVTTGPDGAIWFTEYTGSNAWVGRVALVSGTWTLTNEFPITASIGAGTVPYLPIAGPDGALWFTDSTNMMDRFVLSGSVTNHYPITTGGGYEANGPDGAIWFTEQGAPPAGKIGRITTSGTVTEFSTPSGYPQGLAFGSDGTAYFTENSYAPYTVHNFGSLAFPTLCTLTSTLAPGTYTVGVTTYDATGGASGGGNALSTQTMPVTIAPNATNALNLVLNGVVNSVTPALAGSNPPNCGSGCTMPILLQATDADGRVIIGPGSYVDAAGDPLTITLGVSGEGTLSQTTFTGPPLTMPTLTYGGCFSGATITPSVSGGSIAGSLTPLVIGSSCL